MANNSFSPQAQQWLSNGKSNAPITTKPTTNNSSFSPQASQWLNNGSGSTPSASIKKISPVSSGAQWLSTPPAAKPPSQPQVATPKLSEYQQASPLRRTISDLAHGVANTIHNLPEAHFADKMNFFTPVGFAANLAQGLINTPAEAFKGALSLGEHSKAGTSTPQQVVGDVAAAVQLPLMLVTFGEGGVVKEGIKQTVKNTFTQGAKAAGKAIAKEAAVGGVFGLLGGFQSGKNITNASDYVKNLLQNVGIGAATGAGFGAVTHVALPLAKGLTSKAGAIFVKNVDKTPVIQHVQMDPKVAQSSVLGNEELAKSPVGKEILKQSVIATKTDRHVTITPSENGVFSLPDGTKVDIGTAHVYDPEQKVVDQAVKDKNGLSVEDYVNAKENKFRLSDPRTTESPLSQAEKLFVENFKGSNELWNDIAKDPSKETIDKAIDWLSTRDSSISKNYYTQNAIKLAHYIDAARTGTVVNAPPEMGIEAPTQPKYRIKEDFAKKGINITDKQESDIVELNKKIFGDTDVKVTGQILADGKALGAYKDGIIKILDGQGDAKDTYLHEVVHKYLDLFTNKQEHMDILTEGEKQYKLNDYAQVEEKLAENFIKYAKDREGVTGALRLHFDNILLRIKKYLGNSSKIEELYNEILNANKDKVPEDIRPEEKSSFEQLHNESGKLTQDYVSKFGNVIDQDAAKTLFNGYTPEKAKDYHRASVALRDRVYNKMLEENKDKGNGTVSFTAGGPGSGKSESYESDILKNDYPAIYDTSFSNHEAAKSALDKALDKGYDASIRYVYADPITAWKRALARGRFLSPEDFIGYHEKALNTIKKIYSEYKDNPKVDFHFIDNSGELGKAKEIEIASLDKKEYNKEELLKQLYDITDKAYESGKINKDLYTEIDNTRKAAPEGKNGEVSSNSASKSESNNGEKLQGKDRLLESSNQATTEGQQPVGTGKPRESEAFSKFVDNLKEADPKRYEELKDGKITYNRLNLEQDAKNAMKLVEKDPQQAYRIAKGIEQAPAGQTETAISIALADRAGREGDFAKQAELESSRSLRQTRRGQEIVSERGRFNDNSPYRYIQDVLDKRLKDLGSSIMSKVKDELPGKKTSRKKAAVERLDNETKKVKTMLTKEQRKVKLAQSILDQLTCK